MDTLRDKEIKKSQERASRRAAKVSEFFKNTADTLGLDDPILPEPKTTVGFIFSWIVAAVIFTAGIAFWFIVIREFFCSMGK
jgi:hypothetical protein